MSEALVITSGKGGVGKSTLAANISLALADGGQKVVLIDADTGLRNLDVLLGMENRVVYDLTDVAEGVCRLKQALVKDRNYENLSLIAAAQMRDSGSVTPAQMEKIVGKLREQFDWIIVDCPAGVDRGFRTAIAGADRAIVVALDEAVSIRDAERVGALIQKAGLPKPGLVCNRMHAEKLPKGEEPAWKKMAERLDMQLMGVVPEDDQIRRAAQSGVPAVRGESPSAAAFKRIARRLRGETVAIEPIRRKGFLARIFGKRKSRKEVNHAE